MSINIIIPDCKWPPVPLEKARRSKRIIKDFLARSALTTFKGERDDTDSSNVLSVHIAMCVARGVDFFDKPVKQGRVLYIAADDPDAIDNCIKAYELKNGVDRKDLPINVVPFGPVFGDDSTAAFYAKGWGDYDLIIVNSLDGVVLPDVADFEEEGNKTAANLRKLAKVTDAAVMLMFVPPE